MGLEGASVTVVLIERWEPRLGAAIGAAGLLFGLRIGHRLRERPRVRGVAADFDLALYEETGRLSRAVCSFEIDLFNEGELAPGLRGPCVIFYGEEGSRSWCAV